MLEMALKMTSCEEVVQNSGGLQLVKAEGKYHATE